MTNTGTSTPIYHEVSEDLAIFPLAMKQRSHEQFMREQGQAEWLRTALERFDRWQPLGKPARRTRKRR